MSPRTATWLAWSMWGLSSALTALSLLLLIVTWSYPNVGIFDYWVESTLIPVSCSTVGALIASRRPENSTGWIFCALGLAAGVRHFGAEYAIYALLAEPGSLPFGEVLAWITSWIRVPYFSLFVYLALVFPDGRLPTSRWRWVAWLTAIVVAVGTISVAFSPGATRGLGSIRNPFGIEGVPPDVARLVELLIFALGLMAGVSLFARLRYATWVERQQIKWFAYAITVTASGAILTYTVGEAVGVPWVREVGFALVMVGLVGIPTAVGIAVLKYRLYEIDHIINRTLVYGALTASVVAIYALLVGSLSSLLQQSRGNFFVSLLAAGFVAVLFAPLREKLQRGVNRLMYGERDDPYGVLSRLGRRLEATLEPEAVLPTIVETVASALKLPYVAITMKQKDSFKVAAACGSPVGEEITLPLTYGGEIIGEFILAPRAQGEPFTPTDKRLLEDLAYQAEVAVHAVRLTADLQRSRERLVTARAEERRRLRRDLHDGHGPTLGSLALGLDVSLKLLSKSDLKEVESLLSELKSQTQDAVVDIRRLVYELHPPALDDLGLVSAIRQQASKHGLPTDEFFGWVRGEANRKDGLLFSVEAPEQLPPLPAAVEVACYRIAQEAMTNVVHHARARNCLIRFSVDSAKSQLELEITDDGIGISDDRSAGVGMSSMRERAEELGGVCTVAPNPSGGTRVVACLPLFTEEEE